MNIYDEALIALKLKSYELYIRLEAEYFKYVDENPAAPAYADHMYEQVKVAERRSRMDGVTEDLSGLIGWARIGLYYHSVRVSEPFDEWEAKNFPSSREEP